MVARLLRPARALRRAPAMLRPAGLALSIATAICFSGLSRAEDPPSAPVPAQVQAQAQTQAPAAGNNAGSDSAPAPSKEIAPPARYQVGERYQLTPDGFRWKLSDMRSGEEKSLILPAFHPEYSRPVIQKDRLAYISFTKRGDQFQLGCITFDAAAGKVLNRRDSALIANGDEAPHSLTHADSDGDHVTCALVGRRCTGKSDTHCAGGDEDVTLSFVPLEEARKGLKGKKGKDKNGKHKSGKGEKSAKTGKKAKSTGSSGSKSAAKTSRKAHH